MHRRHVGPADYFDVIGSLQFSILSLCGLREFHKVLDIGCGSLRAGRILIPFLGEGCYYAIEPQEWLVAEGIRLELTPGTIENKKPVFQFRSDLVLEDFESEFDFILAISVFTHAPKVAIEFALNQIAKALTPCGSAIITFEEGEVSYDGESWIDPGTVCYTEQDMIALLDSAALIGHEIVWNPPTNQRWLRIQRKGSAQLKSTEVFSLAFGPNSY